MKAAVDASDPHQSYTPNRNVQFHVWEPLVGQDEHVRTVPALAVSWQAIEPTLWEFKLATANFSDGTPFGPDDVIFSINRARAAEGVRTYRIYVRDIVAMEAVDAHTVRMRTRAAAPLLPANLGAFSMVSARAAEGAVEADFNGGRAAVGTGPYRWVKFTPGSDVTLDRNPHWRGRPEPWSKVIYRFVPNDSARTAGLLAGDLDVIDTVPPSLYARVSESERTKLLSTTSGFTLYFHLDQFRDRSPFVTSTDGRPLDRNPLRDVRVRRAMSLALNRTAIAERAMEGGAEPAGQFMPPGFDGHEGSLAIPPYDPAGARRLLAEAGYPQGFGLTLHCTNDRYAGDGRVCQTVAQMLTAVGIKSAVEALPSTVFFRRAGTATTETDFSAQMAIYSNLSGIGAENMNAVVRTLDGARGVGTTNRGRYSNPELDRLLAAADAALDPAVREPLVSQATRLSMEQVGVIPIFHMKGSWGLRRALTMTPRGDQYTYATDVRVGP
jgi:peptide/nickel transport system substrate-binding protein